jgi:hypothetical protein
MGALRSRRTGTHGGLDHAPHKARGILKECHHEISDVRLGAKIGCETVAPGTRDISGLLTETQDQQRDPLRAGLGQGDLPAIQRFAAKRGSWRLSEGNNHG